MNQLFLDLKEGIKIEGTVESFGFDGYYETDTLETQIEVYVILDEDGDLSAHCESNGILYSEELGGDILAFVQEHAEYSAETIDEVRKMIEDEK